MKRFITLITGIIFITTAVRGESAAQFIENMQKQFQKSAGVVAGVTVTDRTDMELIAGEKTRQGNVRLDENRLALKLSGDDGMGIWFDGKTSWMLTTTSGYSEITVSEPSAQDLAVFQANTLFELCKKMESTGVSEKTVAGTKALAATFTPHENNQFGIEKIGISAAQATYNPLEITIHFNQRGSLTVRFDSYATGRKFTAKDFTCPTEEYPDADINDMR